MFSTQGGSNAAGREAMAALAARLMGGGTPATQSAASKASVPRSVPASQVNAAQPHSQRLHETNASADNATTGHPRAKAEPASQTAEASSTTFQNNGPSLRGSADQLKAAREFMSAATPGGHKSRGGSRSRVLSQDPGRSREPVSHAHPRSPASSTRSAAYAPALAPPRERPFTTTSTAPTSSTSGGLGQWQALHGAASQSDATSSAKAAPIFQDNIKQSTAATAGNSGLPTQKPLPLNTNMTTATPPVKPTSPTIKKENVTPPAVASSKGVNGAPKSPAPLSGTTTSCQLSGKLGNVSAEIGGASKSIAGTVPWLTAEGTKAEDKATKTAASAARSDVTEVKKEPTNRHASASVSVLAELRTEVHALNKRIIGLEAENFTLQKQIEVLLQGEERRKFLGTGSASTPFALEVKDAAANSLKVQVTSVLKVGELIRRIRAQASIAPCNSKDPRVAFNGQQLGHGMMLGEAGVTEGSFVVFTYGGP